MHYACCGHANAMPHPVGMAEAKNVDISLGHKGGWT